MGLIFLQGCCGRKLELLAETFLVGVALVLPGELFQGTGAPLLQLQVPLQAGPTLSSVWAGVGTHPDPLL